MVFYDVEHGSSAYIRTPNGKHVVIDLGVGSYKRSSATFSPLAHLWHKYGIRHLDHVIITHPHRDHLDDIDNFYAFHPDVLHTPRHLTDAEIRAGNQRREGLIVEKFLGIRARYSNPVPATRTLLDPLNFGGAEFRYFQPSSCARGNLNNHSLITLISFAGSRIIVPGDNEKSSWNEMLKLPTFVAAVADADILVAPHHGREAGYCEELFEHIQPKLTIVSDGPGSETSAVGKYCQKSSGWDVYSRSTGMPTRRYCVTTACDQTIVVNFGWLSNSSGRYLNVTTA